MKITARFTKKQKVLGIIGMALVLLIAVYIGISVFFNSRFLFNTTINGVKASGKTVEKMENLIGKEIDGYQMTLEERGGEKELLKGTDISLKPVFDGALQKELKKQNGFAWPLALFRASDIEVETMVDYDEAALEKQIEQLKCLDKNRIKEPKNASVSEYDSKDGYKIVPEEQGTALNLKKFKKVVADSVLNLMGTVSLEEEGCYKEPEYTKDSKEIKKLAETLNKYASAEITYEFGSEKERLDGSQISQWLTVNENMEPVISQEKAAEYIGSLAEKYNTAGKAKSFSTSYGTTVTVSGGDYGWKIDREAELEAILENVKAGEKISKEPAYAKTANSRGANDYGDTYVEINLTAQHLFFYKNGSLVVESDFVSGNLSKGWDTPAGAYGLYYKQRDKTLRGEGYATPVSYWMPFNGGVGLHDATWRNDFGGNYYKKSGSHGCVNLPFSVAKKIYENIDPGCAILVYTLPGSESAKAQAQDAAAAVIAAIGSIGDVTLDSRDLINSARAQYDALNDTAKGYVSNYDVLTAAEARIAQLDQETAAAAADQEAQNQAQGVIDAINNQLAGKEITLDMKETVKDIRRQYDALSDAAKAKVNNYSTLTDAENTIKKLEKES